MSFKDLTLPEIMIAELYKNSLVLSNITPKDLTAAPDTHPVENSHPPQTNTLFQYLGTNLKKVAVIVSYPDDVYLPEAHLTFLISVLKACQLTIADIAIINIARQRIVFDDLKNSLGSDKIIFFEVQPTEVQIDLELSYYLLRSYHELTLLHIPSLEKVNQNNEEGKLNKSKLWLCLKELFSIE